MYKRQDSQGADGRGAGPGSAGAAGQQSRSAGAQSGSVKKRAQTPAEQAASLAALPEGAVEDQIMPAYDTGLLREADLIDAGLRDDEPAQPGRALDSGRNNDSAETGSSHDSGADRD